MDKLNKKHLLRQIRNWNKKILKIRKRILEQSINPFQNQLFRNKSLFIQQKSQKNQNDGQDGNIFHNY